MQDFLEHIFLWFLNPNTRIYYLFLLSSFVLATGYYYRYIHKAERPFLKSLLQYLFPRKVWLHQSAIIDYQIFVINTFVRLFLVLPFLMTNVQLTWAVVQTFNDYFGVPEPIVLPTYLVVLLYTIIWVLVGDFSRFLLHFLLHKIPFLWQLHSVHHAAEVMTPMTLYRVHPLEHFLYILRNLLVPALVGGLFYYFFQTNIRFVVILEVHAVVFFFNLLGANLRHSHVPISFGRILEYIFISPAQHQIHHSNKLKHYDKNFGSILAIWDWCFGSLYLSKEKEKIVFGISKIEQEKRKTLWQNIWEPIKSWFNTH